MYKPVSLFLLFLFLAAVIHTNAVQSADEMISKSAAAIRQPWLNDVMIWMTHLGATSFLLPLIVVIGAGLFFYKRNLGRSFDALHIRCRSSIKQK